MLPPAILVADDLDIVRSLCRNALQSRGFEVLEAADGLTALDLFTRNLDRIVLSIVDISMPGMDGFEVVRSLLSAKPAAAAILISGADAGGMVPPDLTGRCYTLNKPFTVSVLRDLVKKALAPAAAASAASG